jgi:integrase
MALTDLAVRNAKPRTKPYKISDGGGLFLLLQPNGSKLWRLKYRSQGKEKLLACGSYPMTSLAEAREKREAARKLLSNGEDPSQKRKEAKLQAALATQNTFGLIAAEHIERLKATDKAHRTIEKNRWLLTDLASRLTDRPVAEITSAEILDVLLRIEKSGRRESARRLRAAISSVFRLAIVTLRAESDPTFPLRGALLAPKVVHRAAIVDEVSLGGLLRAIDEYDGWPTITAALKFAALTFARPGEIRGARRGEFDLGKAVWQIPAERTKMRRPHGVPLSRQAVAVVEGIWTLSDHGDLVFPSIRSNRRPLSENAFNAALRRMGYTKDEMTAHGFRSTASTILNEHGFNPDVIEAALGHQDTNAIRRAYNRATYWPERVKMLQAWADMLDDFRGQIAEPSSEPVRLSQRR